MRLGGLGEGRIELERFQAFGLAVAVDHIARLLGVEFGRTVVAVGQRSGRSFFELTGRRLVFGAGELDVGSGLAAALRVAAKGTAVVGIERCGFLPNERV